VDVVLILKLTIGAVITTNRTVTELAATAATEMMAIGATAVFRQSVAHPMICIATIVLPTHVAVYVCSNNIATQRAEKATAGATTVVASGSIMDAVRISKLAWVVDFSEDSSGCLKIQAALSTMVVDKRYPLASCPISDNSVFNTVNRVWGSALFNQ